MNYFKTSAIALVVLALLTIHPSGGCMPAAGACVKEWITGPVTWNELRFTAEKFLSTVTTRVHLKTVTAGEARKSLIGVPQQIALQAAEPQMSMMTVQSIVDRPVGSTELISSQAWFASSDAAVLQRIQLRQGDDVWQNIYRFTSAGAYRLRKKPKYPAEKELSPEHWTKVKESFYPFDGQELGCACVLEPSGLLYLAAAINFDLVETPLSVCVFNKEQIHRVRVSVGGYQPLKANYLARNGLDDIRTAAIIDTIKLSFQPQALVPPATEPEAFSFLGLRGDFDIFIDPVSRLPIQIGGKIPGFENMQIRLQQVEF